MGVRNGSTGPGLRGRYGYHLRYRRGDAAAGRRNSQLFFSGRGRRGRAGCRGLAQSAAPPDTRHGQAPVGPEDPDSVRRHAGGDLRRCTPPGRAPPSGSAGVPAARLLFWGAVISGPDHSRENPGNRRPGGTLRPPWRGPDVCLASALPNGTGRSDGLPSGRVREHLAGTQAAGRKQARRKPVARNQGAGRKQGAGS